MGAWWRFGDECGSTRIENYRAYRNDELKIEMLVFQWEQQIHDIMELRCPDGSRHPKP